MKFKIMFMIIIYAISISCHAQEKKSNIKKFDVQLFNSLDSGSIKKGKSVEYKIIKGDTIIKIIGDTNHDFVEDISYKDHENLYERLIYDKDNLALKSSQTYILDMTIGSYKEYNEQGEVIKEVNNDSFPFTMQNLIDVVKNRYGIDLTKERKGLNIGLIDDESGAKFYYIRYPAVNDEAGNRYNFKKISTITGETVFETDKSGDIE